MPRYIDADEVLETMRSNMDMQELYLPTHFIDLVIEDIPTADVQPVKHGRWETWGYIFHGIAWKRCSVCGKTADVSYQALLDGKIEMATPSICGCCGCRMDGDSNDES